MKKNSDRFVIATYCDDIRHEMGNKISLMGCYQSDLVVSSAPLALPKLCVFVSVVTPKERPFQTLTIRIVQDDTELARINHPEAKLHEQEQNNDVTATRKTISTFVVFSPFVIEASTFLKVLATTEEGEIVGPRLSIKIAEQAQSAQIPPKKKTIKSHLAGKKSPAAKSD